MVDNGDFGLLKERCQKFSSYLNKQPNPKEIKVNEYANNSRYIPISFLEMSLDEIFLGLWKTKNFHAEVVANELVGTIDLYVFHPVAQVWLTRTGAAGVVVRSYEKTIDLSKKITNTLTLDYPHLKAECFRNACLSLGKLFGRDLNRKFEDEYKKLSKPGEEDIKELKFAIMVELDNYIGKENYKDQCKEREESGTFDIDFAKKMLEKLKKVSK